LSLAFPARSLHCNSSKSVLGIDSSPPRSELSIRYVRLTQSQMGMAELPHNSSHRRRSASYPSQINDPFLAQVGLGTQAICQASPVSDRSTRQFASLAAIEQLRALAAQGHLLRRGRVSYMDEMYTAATRCKFSVVPDSRRNFMPRLLLRVDSALESCLRLYKPLSGPPLNTLLVAVAFSSMTFAI